MEPHKNIQSLLNPKSIAYLGCSEKNVTGKMLLHLKEAGYTGDIYAVHPKKEPVFGTTCYGTLAEIPGEVEACVVGLRSSLVLEIVEQMHCKGVKAAVFLASGFAETGVEGRELERQLKEKLREYGIAACGPNCLGFINSHKNVYMYNASCDMSKVRGRVGLISHSGSICVALSSAARGAGFSYLISCGNEAGLTVADYFHAMLDDENTDVLAGFLETIRNPAELAEVARLAMERGKPVVILKVGKSEIARQTAAAHSGALASASDVTDAFFRQNNILQVNNIDELSEFCELWVRLKNQAPPAVQKIALTAISGGQLGFCSDIAAEEGVAFGRIAQKTVQRIADALPAFATAKNPLDVTTAMFDTDQYKECVRALAADDDIGMVMVCQDSEEQLCAEEAELYGHIINALAEVREEINKPMVVFSPLSNGLVSDYTKRLDKAGIPLLQGANASMRAVRLYLEWGAMRAKAGAKLSAPAAFTRKEFSFGPNKSLSEREGKKLLAAYGIPVAADTLAQTEEEAVKAADAMGYPVVLKVDSPDILHKTEAGIVRLGLCDANEVREAFRAVMANAAAYDANARNGGVSVQEMVQKGVEVMLGVKNDATFGPSVIVGIGGIFVEVFKDYALRLAPVDIETAKEMIDSLKGAKLLYGARGAAPADVDALADVLVKLSRLAADHAGVIQELDINPLIVLPQGKGAKAVDALVVQK